jgi:chromate reductase, NAD(P)H dehydrogenase (quinone)
MATTREMAFLGIAGSLRHGSYNRGLIRAAIELAPPGVSITAFDLADIPLFNADVEALGDPPAVAAFKHAIANADALVIATPEYNHCVPGVLKNAIDWASRPPRGGAALWGKTVAVAGATTGQYGAIWAQQDLRRILGIAGARVVGGELPIARAHEKVDAGGRLVDPQLAGRLRAHLGALVAEVEPVLLAA